MAEVKLIAAIDSQRGLARDGHIPWDLPSDKKRFRALTNGQIVILGKKTYNEMKLMLGARQAYVVTRQDELIDGAETIHDLSVFLQSQAKDVWVIGGGQIFALALPYATQLVLTRLTSSYDCDVFFPEFENSFRLAEQSAPQFENGIKFYYETWAKE